MRVLRVRVILLLSVLYLAGIFLLYSYLWRNSSLDIDKLFDTPGENPISHGNEFVQFNFKRRNRFLKPVGNSSQEDPDEAEEDELGAAAPAAVKIESPLGKEFGGSFRDTELQAPSLNKSRVDRDNQPLQIGNPSSKKPVHTVASKSTTTATRPLKLRSTLDAARNLSALPPPNYCIHAFYYAWYGNEKVDGTYLHWNHQYLPHWQKNIAEKYPQGRHVPPNDIGANYYPTLGCYSSKDILVIRAHMRELQLAGVGVIAVSWYPPGLADAEGTPPDYIMPLLLDVAEAFSIKVTIHIEPYEKRSALSVREDLKYIHEQYFSHPAFYKHRTVDSSTGKERLLPLIYFYDAYLINPGEWQQLLEKDSENSIRGTPYDCVTISLLVSEKEKRLVLEGGFDGFYTYFASNGFTYGATTSNWKDLAGFAANNNLLFIPSFGPGYEDTRVRPWNKRNSKARLNGAYYQAMFGNALSHNHGGMVSLTSYNEWHEGTQIESARPKTIAGYSYMDYSPDGSDFYLQLTQNFSQRLQCSL